MSSCYKSDLRCAEHPSAHESGIFELLGQLYPARLLFFAVKKKSVAEGIEGKPQSALSSHLSYAFLWGCISPFKRVHSASHKREL